MTLNASGAGALSQSYGVVNFASGLFTGDGSGSVQLNVGFTPRHVRVIDMSASPPSIYEWMEGMAATDTVKITGSTVALDTGSLIVTNSDIISVTEVEPEGAPGAQGPGEGTQGTISISIDSPALGTPQLVLASGLNTSTHLYAWVAYG